MRPTKKQYSPFDNIIEGKVEVKNKRIEKVAEKHDYWRRFKYGSRIFVKTFQGVREIKRMRKSEWQNYG